MSDESKTNRDPRALLTALAIYLGIGLFLSSWATTQWPNGGVHLPVLVFLQNMLLWPIWLVPVIAMGCGNLSH